MRYQSKFIYKIITAAAICVVIASNKKEAAEFANVDFNLASVTKLGCVTADVHDTTEKGLVNRQWSTYEVSA